MSSSRSHLLRSSAPCWLPALPRFSCARTPRSCRMSGGRRPSFSTPPPDTALRGRRAVSKGCNRHVFQVAHRDPPRFEIPGSRFAPHDPATFWSRHVVSLDFPLWAYARNMSRGLLQISTHGIPDSPARMTGGCASADPAGCSPPDMMTVKHQSGSAGRIRLRLSGVGTVEKSFPDGGKKFFRRFRSLIWWGSARSPSGRGRRSS